MNVRNRWFLLLAGLLSVMLVFAAACGDDEDDPSDGETPAATEPSGDDDDDDGAQAPADQQTLVATSTAPEFVDPHKSNFEQDIAIDRFLWRGLYNLVESADGGVEVVPEMAAGEPTIDGTTYTVKLAPDKRWSDGQPVTAADFVYGLRRACDPANASPYQYILGAGLLELQGCDEAYSNEDAAQSQALLDAIGAEAPDETTLVLTLGKVVPNFTTLMSLWVTFPARQDIIEANPDDWATNPATTISNGPFVLQEYSPGNGGQVVLVPNPEWTGQTPALQEVTIRFIDDLTAAFRGYQTGEIQMTAIQPNDVETAQGEFGDEAYVDPGARIWTVQVQMENETLADFNVRLALSRAIDREELVRVVYDDIHEPAQYWTVNGVVGHVGDDDTIGFDVEAAKAALAEAGYPDGAGFPTLSLLQTDNPVNRDLGAYLVRAWADNLGITVTEEYVEGRVRSERFNGEDFQLFPGGWQSDYPDIENFIVGLFDTDGGNNHYNCSMPEIDAAIAEGGSAPDDEARIAAYQEAEAAIVSNLCGVIPLYQNGRPWLVSDTIGGVNSNGVLDASLPGSWNPEDWFIKAS